MRSGDRLMPKCFVCRQGHLWVRAEDELDSGSSNVCPICGEPPSDANADQVTPPSATGAGSGTDLTGPVPDLSARSPLAFSSLGSGLEPLPLPTIAGYEVLGVLGRGGMGVVYQARQLKLNRVVALKMILAGGHASEAELLRFLAEAEAVAQLQHPNIVQLFEAGQHDGLPYFTLEYVAGGSLTHKLSGTPLPPAEAARLVEQLARAVHFAHRKGIVHRDLKPGNVLLAEDGTPKVTDFGLAKRVEVGAGLTATGAVLGTPQYMAPEQAEGKKEVGPAADVYALGAILYERLTGRRPVRGPTRLDILVQVVSDDPVPPTRLQPKLPRDLETICLKCLQKEPPRRYATAEALAEDLRRFQEGKPVQARSVGQLERGAKWVRRNPVGAALTALVGLGLVGGRGVATAL